MTSVNDKENKEDEMMTYNPITKIASELATRNARDTYLAVVTVTS